MRGRSSSETSATATIAVATSARTISGLTAAGRAREEDHALGIARHVLEALDHLCLTPTVLDGRHRCPEPFLELQAKLLDQAQLVRGQLHVALRDQNLAVTRSHPQKLHPGIMSRLTAR